MPGCNTAGTFIGACLLTQLLVGGDVPETADSFFLEDGSVVVCLGDDITRQALYTQYLENYFLTRFPGKSIAVVNAGITGARAGDAVSRFADDVAVHRPTHVVVLLGMNDGGFQAYRDQLFLDFRHNFAELDRRIRELHARPIYLSPTMFDARAARRAQANVAPDELPFYNATLAYYGVWLREFAADMSAAFVDLHGPLNRITRQTRLQRPDFTLIPDGIHPDPAGHLVIAATILEELGLARPLSSIQIARDHDMLTATADGGSVLNLQSAAPNAISFLWQAEALPWPLPEAARLDGEPLEMAEELNRETLQVRGLAPGMYELVIDDRPVGRFSQAAFEQGIALHQLTTPQSEQSRTIARGNRERTDAAIRPAGEDQAVAQERVRVRRLLTQQPEDPQLQQKLQQLDEQLSGFEERRRKFAQISDEWLARLREQSQPVPRQFVIRPILSAQVHGRVLIGGVPISGAIVELHGLRGLTAAGTTDAMGFYELNANTPDGIPPGDGWLVVLAKMVLPRFMSLEKNGHRVTLRSGVNEIELHFEDAPPGE